MVWGQPSAADADPAGRDVGPDLGDDGEAAGPGRGTQPTECLRTVQQMNFPWSIVQPTMAVNFLLLSCWVCAYPEENNPLFAPSLADIPAEKNIHWQIFLFGSLNVQYSFTFFSRNMQTRPTSSFAW